MNYLLEYLNKILGSRGILLKNPFSNISTQNSQLTPGKSKRTAVIIFLLVFGSLSWIVIGSAFAFAFGFGGNTSPGLLVLITLPYIISFIVANLVEASLGLPPGFSFTTRIFHFFDVDVLGLLVLLSIAMLIALLIKKLLGSKYVFIYSIIFGLLPIVIVALMILYSFVYSMTPEAKQARNKQEARKIELQKEQEAQSIERQAKLEKLKATLPIRGPSYLPDFMKKEEESLYYDDQIQIKYKGCFSIREYKAPLYPEDSSITYDYFDSIGYRNTEKIVDIGKGKMLTLIPYGPNGGTVITFEDAGVAFVVYYNLQDGCEKQSRISEEELLKIVSSITQITSSPDLRANWKTYTNTKYGFEFRYPNGWGIQSYPSVTSPNENVNTSDYLRFYDLAKDIEAKKFGEDCRKNQNLPKCGTEGTAQGFFLVIAENKNKLDFETYFGKELASTLSVYGDINRIIREARGGQIGSLKIIKGNKIDASNYFYYYFLNPSGTNAFVVEGGESKATFDQILSTFRFLDVADGTSN